jgi:multidrug efflux pump subunit AcrA (membrane-fusion protein)
MKFKYIVLVVAGLFLLSCGKLEKSDNTQSETSGRKIIETGELSAIDVRAFVLQRYGQNWYKMKIIGMLKHGEVVDKGDSVIQLDPTEIKKYIVDRETELETQKATIAKLLIDQSNQKEQLEANLESELAVFELKKLEITASRFESDRVKRIKNLEFKQAELNIKKHKRKIELNRIVARSELNVQKIREKQILIDLKNTRNFLPALTIKSPIKGIFQVGTNEQNRQPIKIGDEIYFGNVMGSVPSLTWMKVNTTVSENDFLHVKLGQKVKVRLDALPKVVFNGEVSHVGKLCRLKDEKSKQKVFDVEVKMLVSDERLKPGMTVSCEYIEK